MQSLRRSFAIAAALSGLMLSSAQADENTYYSKVLPIYVDIPAGWSKGPSVDVPDLFGAHIETLYLIHGGDSLGSIRLMTMLTMQFPGSMSRGEIFSHLEEIAMRDPKGVFDHIEVVKREHCQLWGMSAVKLAMRGFVKRDGSELRAVTWIATDGRRCLEMNVAGQTGDWATTWKDFDKLTRSVEWTANN